MTGDDPAFKDDVARRLAEGVTSEMATASRRRFAIIQAALIIVLAISTVEEATSKGAFSWTAVLACLALVFVVGLSVRRWMRFSPQPGVTSGECDVEAMAIKSRRCESCRTIVLPGESECPHCGGLRRPGAALAFGVLFGVVMILLSLWRAGFFKG